MAGSRTGYNFHKTHKSVQTTVSRQDGTLVNGEGFPLIKDRQSGHESREQGQRVGTHLVVWDTP